MKKVFLGIVVVTLCILFYVTKKYDLINFFRYKQKIKEISYSVTDIKKVKDGIYEGSYDALYVKARVKVVVKEGKIAEVDLLEHYNDRGAGAEAIIDTIISDQKVDVDSVAGVTNSSKVIKKSVDNALLKGVNF